MSNPVGSCSPTWQENLERSWSATQAEKQKSENTSQAQPLQLRLVKIVKFNEEAIACFEVAKTVHWLSCLTLPIPSFTKVNTLRLEKPGAYALYEASDGTLSCKELAITSP